jgi:Tfp pilus assembly protein PilZ
VDVRESDKRREERVSTALSIDLGTATGVTRDVSASGVFFETDATYALGNEISFAVELDTPGGGVVLKCKGEIVRIEPRDARVGVAVKIVKSTLDPAK